MDEKTKKQIAAAIGVATGGLSALAVATHMTVYDKIFARCERPDYSLVPGLYSYDKINKSLKRELIYYFSDDVVLQGYFYQAKKSKGLVIISHGIKAGADDYLPIIEYMVLNNFSVFAFDCKGTYDSKGDSTVGMCESLVDLDNTIKYLSSNERFNKQPFFLIGHSWGGYAVASALAINDNIKACASIAGMNDGFNMIYDKGSQYAGKLANTSKAFLDVYQRYLFRNYVDYTGVMGINKNNIPVLIAHGVEDEVITFNIQSIYAKKDEITNPNVIYYIGKGVLGKHNSIWHSKEAFLYQKEIESELKLLKIEKNNEITDDDKRNVYKNIDHRLYSEINKELFDLIIKMFNDALN